MLFFITLKSATKLCFKRGSERANEQRVREWRVECGEWVFRSGCEDCEEKSGHPNPPSDPVVAN